LRGLLTVNSHYDKMPDACLSARPEEGSRTKKATGMPANLRRAPPRLAVVVLRFTHKFGNGLHLIRTIPASFHFQNRPSFFPSRQTTFRDNPPRALLSDLSKQLSVSAHRGSCHSRQTPAI